MVAKFSDRLGVTQPPKELQIERMNDDLRVSLWNWIVEAIRYDGGRRSVPIIWKDYFKRSLSQCPAAHSGALGWLEDNFMQFEWYKAYNFVEFVFQNVVATQIRVSSLDEHEHALNKVLERELAGYRMINMELIPITDKYEVEAIRQAMSESSSLGLAGPSLHITKALNLLGKKPEPDYANSIKESISAVESICKLITGEKSGGIDKALAKLSEQASLHPVLKIALSKLYAYTSDEGGIRHAMLETENVGFAEAKFMLVACSAFVNFVLEKAKQAELL